MRGVYTVNYRISGVTTAKTLMYLTAASGIPVDILAIKVTNESNETNEQLALTFQRITSLGTPTATTVTPAKHEKGDQAAASTVKCNVTASEPTYGAVAAGAAIVDAIDVQGVPSLSGYFHQPIPEERLTVAQADSWGLRLLNTITSADLVINVTFQEKG